jgi:uncharacterized SAM-binding protein YcdF (DUF218 family)
MRSWLVERGVDPKRIQVEAAARSTRDNARFTVPLIRRTGASHVTIVTERYHVLRSVSNMKAALREAGLKKVGVDAIAAPDDLRGEARDAARRGERDKLVRDRAN